MWNLELCCHAKFTADLNKLWSPELQNLLIWKVFIYTCKFFPRVICILLGPHLHPDLINDRIKEHLGFCSQRQWGSDGAGSHEMLQHSSQGVAEGSSHTRSCSTPRQPQKGGFSSPEVHAQRFSEHHHSLLLPDSMPRGHQKRVKMRQSKDEQSYGAKGWDGERKSLQFILGLRPETFVLADNSFLKALYNLCTTWTAPLFPCDVLMSKQCEWYRPTTSEFSSQGTKDDERLLLGAGFPCPLAVDKPHPAKCVSAQLCQLATLPRTELLLQGEKRTEPNTSFIRNFELIRRMIGRDKGRRLLLSQ